MAEQRDQGRRHRPAASARRAVGSSHLRSEHRPQHRQLLDLQASVGNRAVAGLTAHRAQPGPTPAIQRRRVPAQSELSALVTAGATDAPAHLNGLWRAISRAFTQVPVADQPKVWNRYMALGGGPSLSGSSAILMAKAIQAEFPHLLLGDPRLLNTGARSGTLDKRNLRVLVRTVARLLNAVVGSSYDPQLRLVFGGLHVAAAKAKYSSAKSALTTLAAADKIVTDRSGYGSEVSLGGLTNSSQIMVAPQVIDHPNSKESIITLLHESMHAGNADVDDFGYIASTSFTTMAAADKLTNAAHFEIVPRQIKKAPHAYKGVRMVPAGTTVVPPGGGPPVTAPPLTKLEEAMRETSERFRESWALGLNLHNLWVRIYKNPADWTGASLPAEYSGATAATFEECMPYWSWAQMLTVHDRAGINPAAGGRSAAPVTQIDVALSEGVTRLMAQAMGLCNKHFAATTDAEKLLKRHFGFMAKLGVTVGMIRNQLIYSILGELGSITGAAERDRKLVDAMHRGTTGSSWAGTMKARSPGKF